MSNSDAAKGSVVMEKNLVGEALNDELMDCIVGGSNAEVVNMFENLHDEGYILDEVYDDIFTTDRRRSNFTSMVDLLKDMFALGGVTFEHNEHGKSVFKMGDKEVSYKVAMRALKQHNRFHD